MQTFDKIIVLDFGSQYNQLITRRIREFGVYSELLSHKLTAAQIKKMNPKGIIFSGGPNSVYDDGAFQIDPEIFELGIPILGICYGMQLMAHNLPGGKVESADNKEYGKAIITVKDQENVMFNELPETQTVWMSHGDLVTQVPEGFEVTATSDNCPISAMANDAKKFYGLQFHTEVRNTEYGNDILRHFAFDICQARSNWSMDDFIDMQIQKIRETVGDKKVLLGLSGIQLLVRPGCRSRSIPRVFRAAAACRQKASYDRAGCHTKNCPDAESCGIYEMRKSRSRNPH